MREFGFSLEIDLHSVDKRQPLPEVKDRAVTKQELFKIPFFLPFMFQQITGEQNQHENPSTR